MKERAIVRLGRPRRHHKRRNGLDRCGRQPPAASAQACPPVEALCDLMLRHGQRAGKNTDGRPGLPWEVSVSVPLVS